MYHKLYVVLLKLRRSLKIEKNKHKSGNWYLKVNGKAVSCEELGHVGRARRFADVILSAMAAHAAISLRRDLVVLLRLNQSHTKFQQSILNLRL